MASGFQPRPGNCRQDLQEEATYVSSFSGCCELKIKYPAEVGRKRLVLAHRRQQSIKIEKVRQQERETTRHILSEVKEQETVNACVPFHTIYQISEPPSFPLYLGQMHDQSLAPNDLSLQEPCMLYTLPRHQSRSIW